MVRPAQSETSWLKNPDQLSPLPIYCICTTEELEELLLEMTIVILHNVKQTSFRPALVYGLMVSSDIRVRKEEALCLGLDNTENSGLPIPRQKRVTCARLMLHFCPHLFSFTMLSVLPLTQATEECVCGRNTKHSAEVRIMCTAGKGKGKLSLERSDPETELCRARSTFCLPSRESAHWW